MKHSRYLHQLPAGEASGPPGKQLALSQAVGLLCAQGLILMTLGAIHYWCVIIPDERMLVQELQALQSQLYGRHRDLEAHSPENDAGINGTDEGKPFADIAGTLAHDWPKMYGKVREKTIWTYWYDEHTCPSSRSCTLPAAFELCTATVEKHRGSFEYRLLHQDEAADYVSLYELPVRWKQLEPLQQRDALMNALLARYGGVALDISVLLLRPIDDYWEEMLGRGATFFGYAYRLNGIPWWHAESLATWFMMSRREGLFSSAVRHQILALGDANTTAGAYSRPETALGDQTLFPILRMFNVTLPSCPGDETLLEPPGRCPENGQHAGFKDSPSLPRRNDTRLLLRDPRDGPLLPFVDFGGWIWDVHNFSTPIHLPTPSSGLPALNAPGGPMYMEDCVSMAECWKNVFLKRFNEVPEDPGSAKRLSFVKLPLHALKGQGILKRDILAATHSFLYNWLQLAGVPQAQDAG